MKLTQNLISFLKHHQLDDSAFLFALSGGSDSMALFHCLLKLRKRFPFSLHVAHIDHGWREESSEEANELSKLAKKENLTFHLKTLKPNDLSGNLEEACREARYDFFNELCLKHQLKGVMVAHHSDDQAETVLKRVFEGAHWSKLSGLQEKATLGDLTIYRPCLSISKKEMSQFIEKEKISFFEDRTNQDVKFLRARMRIEMIPWLNKTFNKDIQTALVHLGEEASDIHSYFEELVEPLFSQRVKGPWGVYMEVGHLQLADVILKMLIRKLCEENGFIPSRQMTKQMVAGLKAGDVNKLFAMGENRIYIDRQFIFIPTIKIPRLSNNLQFNDEISWKEGEWQLKVCKSITPFQTSTWKDAWEGRFRVSLPAGHYELLNAPEELCLPEKKIPLFLKSLFPVISKQGMLIHEFLTGEQGIPLKNGPYLNVELRCNTVQVF